jgi:hypothetical protein
MGVCLAGRTTGRAIVEAHDHGGIGDDDGVAALLCGNLQPALIGPISIPPSGR